MTLPGQKLINGVSSYLFGSNFPPNYTTNTIENTAAIQNLVKQAGVTLLRVAIADGAADSEINARANACAACGCQMLVILPHNDQTFSSHVVTLLGSKCNLYELSNEPDLNGITYQQYLSYWNAQIPAFRKINPNAAFGGPVLGAFSNVQSYLVPWLQGCKTSGVLPDFVSYHDYPCYQISQSACQPKSVDIGNDGASLRQTVQNTLGQALPIACTEWNIDPTASPPAYSTQSGFVTPWFHSAIDSMVTNKLDMACQFDAGSGDSFRDMISTTAPYPVQADYQPMVDKIKQYLSVNSILTGPDTPIGITQGTKNNSALPSQMISDMKTMGIRWLRWQPYAYAIETTQGQYSWGNLDSVVKACNSAGINLMLTVLFPPAWGISNGFPTPQWTLSFAQAMCARYDGAHGFGQIQGIELGNEDYSINGDNPGALAATMNNCYKTLKNAYPSLIVGPGACIHRATATIASYYQTLWQQAPMQFDYINFHYYTQNNNSEDPSVDGSSFSSFPHLLSQLQSAASNAGHPNFPIWITETGFPINSNGGWASSYVISPTTQSNWLKYELDQLAGLGQPAKLFIYTLAYGNQGTPSTGVGSSQGMSLYQVNYSGNPLPAYTMVENYPKNWGGGSSTGTSQRDYALRAGVRTGTAGGLRDYALRAGVKLPGSQISRDYALRCRFVGGIYDTFVRANAASWGNASDGENWVQAGGAATPSIVSNQGQMTGASGTNTMRLGTQIPADVEMLVRVSVTQGGDIIGLTARDQDLAQFVRLRLTATQLQLCEQTPSGGFVVLSNYAYSVAGSTAYWLKFRVLGTALSGKIWQDGTAEPAWLTTASSSAVSGGGQVGLSVALSQATDIAAFDHFSASTASQSTAPAQERSRDFALRANVQGKSSTPQLDFACRAGVADLVADIEILVYAARQGPIIRVFPKS